MDKNNGIITTAVSLDIDLYNEMEHIRSLDKSSRSRFIQNGIRLQIIKIKKTNLQDIADALDSNEKKELQKILNH